MTTTPTAPAAVWRNRIVGHAEVPEQLLANPANWRLHPMEQQQALAGALSEVGWVAQVLVNRTTGHVVDGHLRADLAISRGEPSVPVAYVELSEEEERLVLASLDPLAAMATAEKDALEALLAGLSPGDEALAALLAELGGQNGIRRLVLGDPDEVPPVPDEADVYVKPGDLWALGGHRLLCGDATNPDDVARLLDGAEPTLLATDPPYGVSLDPTWRDGVYNELGPAEQPYMRTPRRVATVARRPRGPGRRGAGGGRGQSLARAPLSRSHPSSLETSGPSVHDPSGPPTSRS